MSRPASAALDVLVGATVVAEVETHSVVALGVLRDNDAMNHIRLGRNLEITSLVTIPGQRSRRVDEIWNPRLRRFFFGPDVDTAKVAVPAHDKLGGLHNLTNHCPRLLLGLGSELCRFMAHDADDHLASLAGFHRPSGLQSS